MIHQRRCVSITPSYLFLPLSSAPSSARHSSHTESANQQGAPMSLQSTGHKFVELCRQGKNFDVMRTMYAPDIVSVEGDGKETKGQQPVIKKSEDWVSDKTFNGETVAGPFFNAASPNQFAV